MNRSIKRAFNLVNVSFVCIALTVSVQAAETVAPGEIISFDKADSGMVECRGKDVYLTPIANCLFPPWVSVLPIPGTLPLQDPWVHTTWWSGTWDLWANRSSTGASAAVSSLMGSYVLDWGVPYYAVGGVYNDFIIDDPDNTQSFIDTQISIVYDTDGGIAGVGNYDGQVTVSLEIEDLSGVTPRVVGSLELFSKDRTGDQGFTDVAVGASSFDRNGETANYLLKLQRGQTYRIWLKAEAYGAPLIFSEVESSVRAGWTELSVAVDQENANDLIVKHDVDIKAAIAGLEAGFSAELAAHDANIDSDLVTHDLKIENQLSTHDLDIKGLLSDILANQEEIIKLLKTPEGKRPGWNKEGY